MKPIKIAVIGTGLIGQRHIEIANRIPECELVAACDANPKGEEIAKRYDIPFYQNYNLLLDEINLDGAVIATPTNTHAPNWYCLR